MELQREDVPALGPAIRVVRHAFHISLDDFAADAGIDKATLSRLERGFQAPKRETLKGIARALRLLPTPETSPTPPSTSPTSLPRRRRSRSVA